MSKNSVKPAESARTAATAIKTRETYEQVWDGDWWPVPKQLDMQCCDCGLVHAVYFRIRMKNKKKPVLEVRFDRNNRATAQIRRRKPRRLISALPTGN